MSLNSRIKERREQLKMTRAELAAKIGVTSSAIANYENDISSPKIELLYRLFQALECDANYLYQDEMNALTNSTQTTSDEMDIMLQYRELDDYGKETIKLLLEREINRIYYLKSFIEEKSIKSPINISEDTTPTKIISFFHKIASAGSGEYLFDYIPTDTLEIPLDHVSKDADFVIGVNGDSMEPHYRDGDKVLVKKTTERLQSGHVGIFMIGNDVLIKRVGDAGLLSDNKKYPDIPYSGTQDIKCIGEVIGKTAPELNSNMSDVDIQALNCGGVKLLNENSKISSFPF